MKRTHDAEQAAALTGEELRWQARFLKRVRALALGLLKPWRGSAPGASLLEYMIVAGFVSLFAIGAFNRFGSTLHTGLGKEATRIEGEGLPSTGDLLASLGDVVPPVCNLANRGFCANGSAFCFEKGTPVATESGDRPIESIKVGERVWARDEASGRIELRPVVTTFITLDQPTLDLELSSGSTREHVFVTPGHRFWVEGSGWTPAENLAQKALFSPDGALSALPLANTSTSKTVYNLEVDGFHTYFVGHVHALVHNQNTTPNPNNCPGGNGTPGNGTGGAGNAGGATTPAYGGGNPLVPCYKSGTTTVNQGSLPASKQQEILNQAAARNAPGATPNDKRIASEKAGEAAAEGVAQNNFPGYTCHTYSGNRVYDVICTNGAGDVVVLEAKGGESSLGTRKDSSGNQVSQGTPQYLRAISDDMIRRGTNRNDPQRLADGQAVRDALNNGGNVRYIKVDQKWDANGNPKPVTVSEFELATTTRTSNCNTSP